MLRKGKLQYRISIDVFRLFLVTSVFTSLLLGSAEAAVSNDAFIAFQGKIEYDLEPISSSNLAVIPNDWSLTFGFNPQYAFIDYKVTHGGSPSIRVEPDYVGAREVNSNWLAVHPGDHIVAKVWIKTGPSSLNDEDFRHGGRLGIDFYASTSSGSGILGSHPDDNLGEGEAGLCVVSWKTSEWTQVVWDFTIPYTYYSQAKTAASNWAWSPVAPIQVQGIVLWLDGRSTTDEGQIWFADSECYINP